MNQCSKTQGCALRLKKPTNYSSMLTKVLLFVTLLMAILFLNTISAEAASIYCVRANATGANDGSDWNNAYTALPATLVRGAIYYIANGNYSGYTFNTATSGSTYITIKKATVSDHGTDTGWDNTYGGGQVLFSGTNYVNFTSSYWIFDGGTGSGSNASSYGFYFTPSASGSSIRPVQVGGLSDGVSNIQLSHIGIDCPGPNGDIQQFGFSGYGNSVTVSNSYVNNCQVSVWSQGNDWTVQNSYFGDYWSSTSNHGVHIEGILRFIFRNNIVTSCPIQCIEPGGGATTFMADSQIYNNVFVNVSGTNGVLKGTSSGGFTNTLVYGNTVINSNGPLLYQNNAGGGYSSGNVVINNLLYNCASLINEAGAGPIAHSNNALFDSGTISETGVQIGTGDPFVDYVHGNYFLKADTNNGQILPAPYNTDINGKVRGSDGVWDRGAVQIIRPKPPLNLSIH